MPWYLFHGGERKILMRQVLCSFSADKTYKNFSIFFQCKEKYKVFTYVFISAEETHGNEMLRSKNLIIL